MSDISYLCMFVITCEVETPYHIDKVSSRNSYQLFECAVATFNPIRVKMVEVQMVFCPHRKNSCLCGSSQAVFAYLQALTGWARWNVVHRVLNSSSSILQGYPSNPSEIYPNISQTKVLRYFASKFPGKIHVYKTCFFMWIFAALYRKRARSLCNDYNRLAIRRK